MNALPQKARADLQKILGLLESEHAGERDAAVRAATRLLERHGMRWCEVLSLLAPIKRAPLHSTWRVTCQRLAQRPADLRPWERRFVADLPNFPRLSVKQCYILAEIAGRVFGERAA